MESCDYRFEFAQVENRVFFKAMRLDGHDSTEEDEQPVRQCLADMGRWEAIAKALSDLLNGTGLSNASSANPSRPNAYEIQSRLAIDLVKGEISLSPEERHRRDEPRLSVDEISKQVENIGKWRNLQRAVTSIRSMPTEQQASNRMT